MEKNKDITKYYQNIKALLPIKGLNEKNYLKGFKQNLDEFLQGNPNVIYQEIVDEYGEPKDVVISYLNNCDEDYLIKKLKIRTIISRLVILIAILATCLTLWFGYLLNLGYHEAKENNITDIESTITEE